MRKLMNAAACVLFLLAGCGSQGAAEEKEELRISAAASLAEVMAELEPGFKESHPGVKLVVNYGSSTKLRAQMEQGAPFDLFLSASEEDIDKMAADGLVDPDSIRVFAGNKLVLATAGEADGSTPAEKLLLESEGKIAVGDPDSVPVGKYTKESLRELGIWDELDRRLVFGKDARQVLSYVESGNAEYGILYSSDAFISKKAHVAGELPEGDTPIRYPAAIAKKTELKAEAEDFLELLTGGQGRQSIEDYGFTVPDGE
ncbi:molybdate ABC transporter substrate-binding protein [Bhargavaea ullalensis]|uniref:Molybdate transport system substrate-binding protein n=1 Tax=Bhargavaea ullalensis TaxID=1265685 RepID=A0ABV2G7D7_9BACL